MSLLLPHIQSREETQRRLKNDWKYLPSIQFALKDNREAKVDLSADALVVKEVYKRSLLNRKLKREQKRRMNNN